MMTHLAILFTALLLDRVIGDPQWAWRHLPHPVVLFGAAIGSFDRAFNRDSDSADQRRLKGAVAIGILFVLALAIGLVLQSLLRQLGFPGLLVEAVIVAVFLAQKSLAESVWQVFENLQNEGLEAGRKAVSMIVGRDPATLDEAGVVRAAIESLAENFSDGVVAPAFWYAVLGLPGLLAYKMLNTADSMIAHRNERYLDFGRAAAKLDDLVNLPASRLSAVLIAGAAGLRFGWQRAGDVLAVVRRDARLHRSPNAGWPEAAMAAALGIALGGPRVYAGEPVDEPMLNAQGRVPATLADIATATGLFWHACTLATLGVALLFALLR